MKTEMQLKIEYNLDTTAKVFVIDAGVWLNGRYLDFTNFSNHSGWTVGELIAQGLQVQEDAKRNRPDNC